MNNELNESQRIDNCLTEAESLFGTMREATYEEQASVNRYITNISKETGIDFFQLDDSQKLDRRPTYNYQHSERS